MAKSNAELDQSMRYAIASKRGGLSAIAITIIHSSYQLFYIKMDSRVATLTTSGSKWGAEDNIHSVSM